MLHRSLFTLHKQQNDFSIDFLVKLSFEYSFSIIYTYEEYGDDCMKIEEAPSNIRAFAACLWIIPAIFLSYLFQNRFELFFLEPIYVAALIGSFISDFSDFSNKIIPRIVAAIPCAINSYYFLLYFQFKFPTLSFSEILILLLLSVPIAFTALIIGSIIGLILQTPIVLISMLFSFIADVIYTFLKRASLILTFFTIFIISCSLFLTCAALPENFSLSPLPPISIESQEKSEEVETVYISTYGKCYHSNPDCSGMKYARSVTLEAAQKTGRRACSKCYRKKH